MAIEHWLSAIVVVLSFSALAPSGLATDVPEVEDPMETVCVDVDGGAGCSLVAVSGTGNANCWSYGCAAVSGTGDTKGTVSATGGGDAKGSFPVSATGQCKAWFGDRGWVDCYAVNATSEAHGMWLAVSATDDAHGYTAVSLTGDAHSTGYVGVSATGNASGYIAISGCQTGQSQGTDALCH